MYLISATPLAKIFQTKYHLHLRANPQDVYKKEKFDIVIPRSNGDYKFVCGSPKLFTKKTKEFDDDYQATINWLIGGEEGNECSESDFYGVVKFPSELDIMGMLTGTLGFDEDDEEAAKKKKKIEASIQPDLKGAMIKAQALSEERVMRAVRAVYKNLKTQYERNKEQKLGDYLPSTTEFLCLYVLSKELRESSEKEKALTSAFSKHMAEVNLTQ